MKTSNTYWISVKTADEYLAGTDANIFVRLHGTQGDTGEVRLNGLKSGNIFERDETNNFTIDFGVDVGDIYKITLRSDNAYGGSGWRLDWIKAKHVVDGMQTPECYFSFFDWIEDTRSRILSTNSLALADRTTINPLIETTYGAMITVPANTTVTKMYETIIQTAYNISKTQVNQIETETGAETKISYAFTGGAKVEGAMRFALKSLDSQSSTEEVSFITTETKKIEFTPEVSPVVRKFRVVNEVETIERYVTLGTTQYVIPGVRIMECVGFEEIL